VWNDLNRRQINSWRLTLIIGSRCADGVVLIADRIVTTQSDGLVFYCTDKLFSVLEHVVIGSSGSSGNFELFRNHVLSYINRKSTKVSADDILLTLSNQTYNLNERYRGRNSNAIFDILLGRAYQDRPSTLTYVNSYGLPNSEEGYRIIGSGTRYAKVFLQRMWNRDMPMGKVAELGYFAIRYIEQLKLDHTVGLGGQKPQIWYMPDNYKENDEKDITFGIDRLANDQELQILESRVKEKVKRFDDYLAALFKD